eukprot:5408649-Amphidinium_carterae.1
MEELRTITGGSRPPVLRAHSDRAAAFLGKDVKKFLQAHDIRQIQDMIRRQMAWQNDGSALSRRGLQLR